MKTRVYALATGIAVLVGLGLWAGLTPGAEREIGCYVTGLRGRTLSQIYNLTLATRKINNCAVMPGQTFSFNKTVGPWTADVGYEKAPVSYDGELVKSWGGGVCQASTTLYNAALLAGLDIVERHCHHWPPRYAPPGGDAAVAYSDIDLKFKNNLPAPVRIVGELKGDSIVFRILSRSRLPYKVRLETEVRRVVAPGEVLQDRTTAGHGRWRLINRGHPGYEVATYRRLILPNGASRRQLIAEDQYPAVNRIMRIAER